MRDSDFKRKLFWECIDNLGKKGRVDTAKLAEPAPHIFDGRQCMRDSDFKRKLFWECIDNLGKKWCVGTAKLAEPAPHIPQQPQECHCKKDHQDLSVSDQ